MSYLLDTCVISQLRRQVSSEVRNWFDQKDPESFFISSVTIAELWDGIERLGRSKKRNELEDWFFGDVKMRFKEKIISIDEEIAIKWGSINAALLKKGKVTSVQDLYIAATAASKNFALVTINVTDFEAIDITIINPWNFT